MHELHMTHKFFSYLYSSHTSYILMTRRPSSIHEEHCRNRGAKNLTKCCVTSHNTTTPHHILKASSKPTLLLSGLRHCALLYHKIPNHDVHIAQDWHLHGVRRNGSIELSECILCVRIQLVSHFHPIPVHKQHDQVTVRCKNLEEQKQTNHEFDLSNERLYRFRRIF